MNELLDMCKTCNVSKQNHHYMNHEFIKSNRYYKK